MENSWIRVVLDPKIFPVPIVLNAAYMLLNKFTFRIEGEPESAIVVRLRPLDSHLAESTAYLLNRALIRASINAYQMEQTAEVRHYFLKASLSFEGTDRDFASVLEQKESEVPLEPLEYSIVSDLSGGLVHVSVDIGRNHLKRLLLSLFYVVERLNDDCWLILQEVKDSCIIAYAKPRCGTLDSVTLKLEEELAQLCNKPIPFGVIQSPIDIFGL